jgi:serine/threonine-protein kinase
MALATAGSLVDAVRQFRLLEPAQLQELGRLQKRWPDPRLLAKELHQRGWLTSYQINLLLSGRGSALVLGPYHLLEKLGEGGYGQVYKARHQTLHRIVALKVLRPDLLSDKEAVSRFYREMEVASKIDHPNIVHAFDAGPIGSALVLAMEYVNGVGLDRLVRDRGPLAVAQAVNYICQAAQGLQHAHERGLIHRDIKPANLLVSTKDEGPSTKGSSHSDYGLRTSSFGLVKILDLGLARLQQPSPGSPTSNLTILSDQTVTQGTPEYMSPEQALDFHSADGRADIYSLGCTFYYLLTGSPPFPTGSLAEKLMQHQQAEPPAVEKFRSDLPVGLADILRKMLAKQPKERPQNLGEVMHALAPIASENKTTERFPRQETLAGAPGLGSDTQRAAKKIRRRLALAVVGLAFLVALGLLPLLLSSKPSLPAQQKSGQDNVSAIGVANNVLPATNWVTVTSVSSGRPYDTSTATVGVAYWIDRDYKITSLSSGLEDGVLVRGANSDKNVNSTEHLTLTLSLPGKVYVAYDIRGKQLPAWLADGTWQLTNESLSASGGDAQASPMKVYAKQFPAGRLTLGGNKQAPAGGAGSNYVVIVKPLS